MKKNKKIVLKKNEHKKMFGQGKTEHKLNHIQIALDRITWIQSESDPNKKWIQKCESK